MNSNQTKVQCEPVPAASQLAVVPFLSALLGFLQNAKKDLSLRLTLHRVLVRQNEEYLQQVCDYLGPKERSGVGRVFPVDTGIMGAAYQTQQIWRTRPYSRKTQLYKDLIEDLRQTGDSRKVQDLPLSFLAIPFLGPKVKEKRSVVMILFGDCYGLNFFADDLRISKIVDMCSGFCSLFDSLEGRAFSNIRNFPLVSLRPVPIGGGPLLYPRLQEQLKGLACPAFKKVASFNYEAAAM